MAVVRILVDGYGLLQHWPEIAPGKARLSEAAREEIIYRLTQYYDISGTPMTMVFYGQPGKNEFGPVTSCPELEVIYTPTERSAEQLMERVVSRMKHYGDVLVVTDDQQERKAVESIGGTVSSCAEFIEMVQGALAELHQDLTRYNEEEQSKFRMHS